MVVSRQDILTQNKRFLATPFGSFTALPLLCCMCLKGSRHSFTHAPCTENAVKALKQYLEVDWVCILAARGGMYAGTAKDTQTNYLKDVFSFIGLDDVEFVYAEGLAMGGDIAEKSFSAANEKINELIQTL